jgi:hypothetical protein
MDGVERLALVSKVLLDSRLCELKSENEALRLQVFWLQHSFDNLSQRMQWANCSHNGPFCTCHDCLQSGRFHSAYAGPGIDRCVYKCTFKPFFECLIAQCGMSVGYGETDTHTHFRCIESNACPRVSWYTWQYGSSLTCARTSTNADLCKLKHLFQVLGDLPRSPPMCSGNHTSIP